MKRKITQITFQKKDILLEYSENNKIKEITLTPSVYSDFYLYEGKEIPEEEWKSLCLKNEEAKTMQYAYNLVARSSYSKKKLEKKLLEKGYPEKDIRSVLKTLEQQGLIDDEQYAKDYIEYMNEKNYGQQRILEDLKEDGIPSFILSKFSFPDAKEKEKLKKVLPLLSKKWSNESHRNREKHLYEALYRRGFTSELIQKEMALMGSRDEDQEWKACSMAYLKYQRLYATNRKQDISQRIITALMRKGFSYDIIKQVMEAHKNEVD